MRPINLNCDFSHFYVYLGYAGVAYIILTDDNTLNETHFLGVKRVGCFHREKCYILWRWRDILLPLKPAQATKHFLKKISVKWNCKYLFRLDGYSGRVLWRQCHVFFF